MTRSTTPQAGGAERYLEIADLHERVRWLLLLRCLAMPALLVLFVLGRAFIDVSVPWYQVVGVVLAVGVYNYAFYLLLARRMPGEEAPVQRLVFLRRHAALQIVFDLVALTLLLFFSGGARNPFAFFYVFHIIFASILLPRGGALAAVALAVVLHSGLAALEATGLLPPHPLFGGRVPGATAAAAGSLLVAAGALALTLALVGFFSTSLTLQLRRRARELSRAAYAIEGAVLTDAAAASSAEAGQARGASADAARRSGSGRAPRLQHLLRGFGADGEDPHARLLAMLAARMTELQTVVDRQLARPEGGAAGSIAEQEKRN